MPTRVRAAVATVALGLIAAACSTSGGGGGLSLNPLAGLGAAPPVAGETLGSGAIKVGLLLPLSATGSSGQLAQNLRNAADLALRDFPTANLQILVKDDSGTAEGAAAAASQAVAEGAQLILGPVFADAVRGAAGAARNVPVVSFSTDTTKIQRGVYLLSFLPQGDVDRIVSYASAKGKRRLAAILPNTPAGALYEAAFQRAVANSGGQIVSVEHYDGNQMSMQQHATALAMQIVAGGIDAVFMPDSGDASPFLAQIIAANGVKPGKVTYLGSGQWNDPRITGESNLTGGWYPGPDNSSFGGFTQRYKAAFGATPIRNATLSYDAVTLAATLAMKYGADRFTPQVLTNANGFIGIDGAFRLNADGTSTRGLAVYEINRGKTSIVDPAPQNFNRLGA
jgi:ABC-type branched-subunit amino acid transport system substrate-binding protein